MSNGYFKVNWVETSLGYPSQTDISSILPHLSKCLHFLPNCEANTKNFLNPLVSQYSKHWQALQPRLQSISHVVATIVCLFGIHFPHLFSDVLIIFPHVSILLSYRPCDSRQTNSILISVRILSLLDI